MVLGGRVVLGGTIVTAILWLLLGAAALAARPNALDLRVDGLTTRVLLTEPATALVDPARQAGAIRRTHWTVFGFVLTQLFEAVALFYLWSSGGAARMRDALGRRFASDWSVRFLFGALLALVARLASIVPSFYLYRVDRTLELTTELTRVWALYWVFHTILAMIIAGLIVAIILWLVSLTHQWYLYAIAGVLAASVAWSYISTQLRAEGFAGLTPPEVKYRLAYLAGHIAHGDRLSIALIEGGIIIVFAAIAVVIADRIPFRRDDDPLSRLTIVGSLLALVYLAAVPVRNAALRSYDLSADEYAIATTGDPAAAVRTLVRAADERMIEVCPELTATLFLYTTPAVGTRVAAINHIRNACP
jgi:Peptidase family M48